jgi:Tfp pilus assembly protein PilZ
MKENSSAEPNAVDRRQSDRKKLIVDVHFEDGDATGIANTCDISTGGLFLKTNASLTVGSKLLLRITLAGKSVILDGCVAFAEAGNGFGIGFESVSAETKKIIESELDML